MEQKSLKLDIYNNAVCNNLYNCQKDEKYCRTMVSKLVFYDRDDIVQMHSDTLMHRGVPYDVSKLEVKPFLESNEKVERVVPLESHWIAVILMDKKSKQTIKNKVLYVSSDGDGFYSNDLESALNGIVPEEMYLCYIKEYPNGIISLDKKYLDGEHDEFLKRIYDVARTELTQMFAAFLKNDDIKLEDVYPIISHGYKHKNEIDDFEKIRLLDFLYSQTASEIIIEFDKKYKEKNSVTQPGETE